MCRKCGLRESTGVLIQMCDPCFDAWEAEMKQRSSVSPDGKAHLDDAEAMELTICMGESPKAKA